jgi:hypothetical protein
MVDFPGAENRLTKPSKYDPKPGDPEGKILAFDGTSPEATAAPRPKFRFTIRQRLGSDCEDSLLTE